MKKLFLGPLMLIGVLLIASCNDNPSSVGSDLIPSTDDIIFKTVDTQSDNIYQSSSFFKKKIDLGISDKLILGKNAYAESAVLLRFDITVTDSLLNYFRNNTGSVSSAWMEIAPSYYLGDKNGILDFEGHQIKTEWNPNGFDKDSLAQLSIDNTNIVSNIKTNDSLVTFNVNKSYVEKWVRKLIDSSIEDNYGIYLKPTAASNRFIGFDAYSIFGAGDQPYLRFVISKPNNMKPDTLVFLPYIDGHIVAGDLPDYPGQDLDFLQGGLSIRSALKFDLKNYPSNYAVNSARLELTLDTTKTFDGIPSSQYITVRQQSDSTTHALTADSVSTATLTRNGSIYSGDISPFVQKWVKEGNNQGIMLQLLDETTSVARIAYYNSKAADASLRPRLKIIFMQKK